MGLYLGANNLIPAGGGGGAIPETAIFNRSGVWLVPQSVQSEIAAEGHAEIGLFMVGGGATTGNSGEIVSELYQLTTADYDPQANWNNPNQPEITVTVGGVNIDTGITLSPNLNLTTQPFTRRIPGIELQISNLPLTFGEPRRDANNYPLVTQVTTSVVGFPPTGSSANRVNGVSGMSSFVGFTTDPTVTTAGNFDSELTLTWDTPQPFDGTFTLPTYSVQGGTQRDLVQSITYDATNDYFVLTQGLGMRSATQAEITINVTYLLEGNLTTKLARSGSSTETSQFLNLSTSTEGYFGGYGRVGSTRPNSGAPGQAGYVQIFYT